MKNNEKMRYLSKELKIVRLYEFFWYAAAAYTILVLFMFYDLPVVVGEHSLELQERFGYRVFNSYYCDAFLVHSIPRGLIYIFYLGLIIYNYKEIFEVNKELMVYHLVGLFILQGLVSPASTDNEIGGFYWLFVLGALLFEGYMFQTIIFGSVRLKKSGERESGDKIGKI